MAASVPSASPCLIAILLVTQPRSGSGARLVFHYPPEPLSSDEDLSDREDQNALDDDTSSSSSDDGSSTEDQSHGLRPDPEQKPRVRIGRVSSLTDDEDSPEHTRGDQQNEEQRWKPSWEPLLGLGSNGLAGLLAAGRAWHMQKFELGINNLCFVGRPAFAHDNGHWKRQKSQKASQSRNSLPDELPKDGGLLTDETPDTDGATGAENAGDSNSSSKKSPLTMFNVVFVLDPPTFEHEVRVKEMYKHVVKSFTRALMREQTRRDFVWHESQNIQSIKTRHLAQRSSTKTLYAELLSKSQLAASIASVFRAISASRIVPLTLSPSTSVVLQIPPVVSISLLPSLTDPPAPAGLWLTTFNDGTVSWSEIEGLPGTSPDQLAKHVTLLLKESPQRIIRDAQAQGGSLAAPLTKFVSALKPTKSFHKLATTYQKPWREIEWLASHLITWRRAILIPPLHQRDTYIVSPNADMSKLKVACKAYNATFPTLPGLATILGALSDQPRPWMALIPSTDHKEVYYEILAWLMKGGWVTQLRTFAYIRVSPEVKRTVREQEKKNELEKKSPKTGNGPAESSNGGSDTNTEPLDTDTKAVNTSSGASNHSFTSDTSRRPSLMSYASSQHQQTLASKAAQDPNTATLILNPSRASPLESKWIEYIADTLLTTPYSPAELSQEERVELRTYWLRFVKYFNGNEPLEYIPVREGLKRTVVWDLLGKMGLEHNGRVEREGPERNANRKILVTVRHW